MSNWLNIQLIILNIQPDIYPTKSFRSLNLELNVELSQHSAWHSFLKYFRFPNMIWMSNWHSIRAGRLSFYEFRAKCGAGRTFNSTKSTFFKVFSLSVCRVECRACTAFSSTFNFKVQYNFDFRIRFFLKLSNVELIDDLAQHLDRHSFLRYFRFFECWVECRAGTTSTRHSFFKVF